MATDPLPLDFGRDKRFCVYLYRDPRPGKRNQPIYVGKGSRKRNRADAHWRNGCKVNLLFAGILGKIRAAGLEPIIEIVGWFDDEAGAFALECALIKRFGRRDQGSGPLANLTDGGEGGANPSDEVRRKIGEKTKARAGNYRHSPESKKKISLANTGELSA